MCVCVVVYVLGSFSFQSLDSALVGGKKRMYSSSALVCIFP